jgi:hypothetical protein
MTGPSNTMQNRVSPYFGMVISALLMVQFACFLTASRKQSLVLVYMHWGGTPTIERQYGAAEACNKAVGTNIAISGKKSLSFSKLHLPAEIQNFSQHPLRMCGNIGRGGRPTATPLSRDLSFGISSLWAWL